VKTARHIGQIIRLSTLCALLAIAISALGQESKTVVSGSAWVVARTTHLSTLTIEEGATLKAQEGYSLTLTVNGVEMPIAVGQFSGDIVLTAAENIPITYDVRSFILGATKNISGEANEAAANALPAELHYNFRAAVYVEDGTYLPEQSVSAAAVGGSVTGSAATGVTITSANEGFNGIAVRGKSTYKIVNPRIDLTGNGINDFAGNGAAIMVGGESNVTVENANIGTKGVVRTAIWVGEKGTVTVNNSFVDVYDGVLPTGYKFSVNPGEMMEAPYGLGISGNDRATNLMDSGTAYYNNSHLRTHGWGVLSTDGSGSRKIYATNTWIEAVGSGYGAYAMGDALVHFSHCVIDVADIGLIVGAQGSGVFTDGTIVNSGRFGVMMHQGQGGGQLTIDKGSIFHTKATAIEVKGRGANIVVDGASIYPEDGVILQTLNPDDPYMTDLIKKAMAAGGGPPKASPRIYSGDVVAAFKNVNLRGDLIHAMKGVGDMVVTLENSTLTGAITTAVASPASGAAPTRETFHTIGVVKNAFASSEEKYGLCLTVGSGSQWIVERTSYLNSLTLVAGATIKAPAGFSLSFTVDGARKALEPGSYSGKIVLSVVPPA
jgi:hypothetical protein